MTDGIVIDANIITDFYNDYKIKSGPVYELMVWIINNTGIAINGHISAEWRQVCSADLFISWYVDQLKLGKIRNIKCGQLPKDVRKKMVSKYGFPDRTLDIHYVICAYYTNSIKYILTNNYHFYEPKCIRSALKTRIRAREQRQGSFLIFLRRELGINVGMVDHCKSDFAVC